MQMSLQGKNKIIHILFHEQAVCRRGTLSLTIKQLYLSYRTLSGDTTPGQNRPGSNGNEGVFCIP